MKFLKTFLFVSFVCSIFCGPQLSAQTFEDAGQYLEHINNANKTLTEKYLVYLSAVSHSKSTSKMEKTRQSLLNSIEETRYDIMGTPPYKGDRKLRDTTLLYLKILQNVFNEDYGKIVNMEEIAEQSYDLMEAYLLAQEKANEKLNQAGLKQREIQKEFAQKYNITLIESSSPIETKMKIATEVMSHYNDVYLIFFKSYKQEAYLTEAVNAQKVNSIEQNLSSLEKFNEEGFEKLKNMSGYNSDASLIIACRNMLNFYADEVKKGSMLTDFYLKEESFNKIKKQFDSKPQSKRTQQDVDQYNKAVNEMNEASAKFNALNVEINKQRDAGLKAWNKAVSAYMDTYMPTHK